ncbi:hypothetical protein H9L25_00950 [Terrisporobacter mayombei]|nr:hypothetical protein [Terrisporobacter mayombei]
MNDKFTPSSEQACNYADTYWKEKFNNRVEVLEDIEKDLKKNIRTTREVIKYHFY